MAAASSEPSMSLLAPSGSKCPRRCNTTYSGPGSNAATGLKGRLHECPEFIRRQIAG